MVAPTAVIANRADPALSMTFVIAVDKWEASATEAMTPVAVLAVQVYLASKFVQVNLALHGSVEFLGVQG